MNPNVLILRKYSSRKVQTVRASPRIPLGSIVGYEAGPATTIDPYFFSQFFLFTKVTAGLRIRHKPNKSTVVNCSNNPYNSI